MQELKHLGSHFESDFGNRIGLNERLVVFVFLRMSLVDLFNPLHNFPTMASNLGHKKHAPQYYFPFTALQHVEELCVWSSNWSSSQYDQIMITLLRWDLLL